MSKTRPNDHHGFAVFCQPVKKSLTWPSPLHRGREVAPFSSITSMPESLTFHLGDLGVVPSREEA
jgi:hypothetical protein